MNNDMASKLSKAYQAAGVEMPVSPAAPARPIAQRAAPVPSAALGDDYVDRAERVMRAFTQERAAREFTTSKIRNILSAVSELFNEVQLDRAETLSPEITERIQHLRVRLVYEAGRTPIVKTFVTQAGLIDIIKGIGNSRDRFIRFANYMEALVSYHRFYGGNDK